MSDTEMSSSVVLPGFTRIQSRLNPVPESLNSPDIAPGKIKHSLMKIHIFSSFIILSYSGPSPPRRDDPMISGPLSSLPPDLESRLKAVRNKSSLVSSSGPGDSNVEAGVNGHSTNHSPRPRPSDIMVAAVTARTNGAKTPGQSQVGVMIR